MNPEMNDRNLFLLPHPVRVDAARGQPAEELMLRGTGLLDAVRPHLSEETATSGWIINRVPGMQELALIALDVPGGFNMGTFVLLMRARPRLRAHGDPLQEVAASLLTQLLATDLGAQLPVCFFRCPCPAAYIELARPSSLRIANRGSGLHEVEGTHIATHRIPPTGSLPEKPERVRDSGSTRGRRPTWWSW